MDPNEPIAIVLTGDPLIDAKNIHRTLEVGFRMVLATVPGDVEPDELEGRIADHLGFHSGVVIVCCDVAARACLEGKEPEDPYGLKGHARLRCWGHLRVISHFPAPSPETEACRRRAMELIRELFREDETSATKKAAAEYFELEILFFGGGVAMPFGDDRRAWLRCPAGVGTLRGDQRRSR